MTLSVTKGRVLRTRLHLALVEWCHLCEVLTYRNGIQGVRVKLVPAGPQVENL
jgi:hypothetical protein